MVHPSSIGDTPEAIQFVSIQFVASRRSTA
jgi:hypothetical protein